MPSTKYEALRGMLEAKLESRANQLIAEELAVMGRAVLELARAYLARSSELLDEAELCAVRYAHVVDAERAGERWPEGLEAEIARAMEDRDAGAASVPDPSR